MQAEALDIQISVNRSVPDVSIGVARNWKTVEFDIDKGGEYHLPYDGPYEVDASFYYAKVLDTYGRVMGDDVTVKKIPVLEVSNPQGGKTVTIGEW